MRIVVSHEHAHNDALEAWAAGASLAVLRSPMEARTHERAIHAYDGSPALILSTSASTGSAKLVVIPWTAVEARCNAVRDHFGTDMLSAVGILTASSARGGVHSPALVAARMGGKVVPIRLHETGWGAVDAEGITCLMAWRVPAEYGKRMPPADGGSLRTVIVAGYQMDTERQARIADVVGAPVVDWYGSTEAGTVAAGDPDGMDVLPGVEARISDGLVEVRSPGLASSYLHAPLSLTEDGWLKMGDRGDLRHGKLWVAGRDGVHPKLGVALPGI